MKKKLVLVALVFVLALGAGYNMAACDDNDNGGTGTGSASTDSAISTGGVTEEEEELVDSGDPTAVTGTWKLTSMKVGEDKLDESQLKNYDYSYVFHNRIADVTINGKLHKSMEYRFENDEVHFTSERLESYGLKLQKGKLVLTESIDEQEAKLSFEKQ